MNKRRAMVSTVWTAALFCVLAGTTGIGLALAAGSDAADRPKLILAETVVRLGRVLENEELSACFKLRNAGGRALLLHEVKAGCRCTRVHYPREVPPSGRVEICMTIDTTGSHGPAIFTAVVHSNDPVCPIAALRVEADVEPLVVVKPDRVFLMGKAGSRLRQEVVIESRGKAPLKVRLLPHDLGDRIKVALIPVIQGKRYRLVVENRGTMSESYRGRLMVWTDALGRERIVVPVFVYLRPVEGQ